MKKKNCYTISLSIFVHNFHCHNLRRTWKPWYQISPCFQFLTHKNVLIFVILLHTKFDTLTIFYCTANKHDSYKDFDQSPCFALYIRASVTEASFFKFVSPHYVFPNWKAYLLILHGWHIRIIDETGDKNLLWIWLQHVMCNKVTRRCG